MKGELIYGVGINDVTPVKINGKHIKTYLVWRSMLSRCYNPKYHKSCNYADCSVCEEWHLFSNFKRWMEQQDWEGKELDKDLLVEENKVYSPETCCFIPQSINKFLTLRGNLRGKYPLGVHIASNGKFIASISCKGFLGRFVTEHEAHRAWQNEKLNKLKGIMTCVKDSRVMVGLQRVYTKLENDIINGLETKTL